MTEIAQSQLNYSTSAFDEFGYVVIPDVLSSEEVQACHDAFDALPMRESRGIHGVRRQANERVVFQDERLLHVVTRPALIDAIRQVVGDGFQLLDCESVDWDPHTGKERDWHADFHFFSEQVLTVNVAIYLRDMEEDVGPLLVVPGSHKWNREPTPEENAAELDGEVKVIVPAGTGVAFNTLLWHSGGRNNSDLPRRAIFPYFGHYWIKRMDDFYLNPLPDHVVESEDPLIRQLFGLELSYATSVHGASYRRGAANWE